MHCKETKKITPFFTLTKKQFTEKSLYVRGLNTKMCHPQIFQRIKNNQKQLFLHFIDVIFFSA